MPANPTGDPDCHKPQYSVRFEERKVEALKSPEQNGAFERMRAVSEAGENFYRTFVSPWVQMATNPWFADTLKWLHPMRASRYLFSERFSPCMHAMAQCTEAVKRNRHPLPEDHPLKGNEGEWISGVTSMIERGRKVRDAV